jgi:hypothetical protein
MNKVQRYLIALGLSACMYLGMVLLMATGRSEHSVLLDAHALDGLLDASYRQGMHGPQELIIAAVPVRMQAHPPDLWGDDANLHTLTESGGTLLLDAQPCQTLQKVAGLPHDTVWRPHFDVYRYSNATEVWWELPQGGPAARVTDKGQHEAQLRLVTGVALDAATVKQIDKGVVFVALVDDAGTISEVGLNGYRLEP